MSHRGPDDEGIYLSHKQSKFNVGLGHRRLKIIDLSSAGHQPICNEDKTLMLICNGEIYNYKQLKADLLKKGHRFSSDTDIEVIVHLFEEKAEEAIEYLRGMFAFALWDEKQAKLILARDRTGQKPLLYYHSEGLFCFASEFSSLLESGLVPKRINEEAIHYYLSFGYIPAPLTIYENVYKLPPAHILVLKNKEISLKRYWQLDYSKKIKISEVEAQEELLRLLKEAVKIRLYSDVPLGAFLSGGLDSSTVVALMSQLTSEKVKTFSIGFQEHNYSELKFARNIAKRFQTEHHEFIVKPKALEILPLLVQRYGEPYADSSCIPTYYVSQQTRQYVTVALNGDGGDESFSGYERYQAMLIAQIYQDMPRFLSKIINRSIALLPDSINPKNSLRRIKRFFEAAPLPQQERYLRWIGMFDERLKRDLYSERFLYKFSNKNPICWLNPHLNNSKTLNLLDRLLMTDTNTYLPNDLLVKVDIASMANSLEARSPFLDHKLMEFVASLPPEYKMKKLVKKYILKKAVKDLVPKQNIHRRKMGFGLPIGEWFRSELKELINQTLLSKSFFDRGYFKPDAIKMLIKAHLDRNRDYTFQIWTLLMLELWHQKFID